MAIDIGGFLNSQFVSRPPYVATLPSFPKLVPLPTPTPPVVVGLEPQAYDAVLYGKVMPVFIGGKLLIGGRIIEGPYYTPSTGDQLTDYVAFHALCADPAEPRTVTEYRLRGQAAWTLADGYLDITKLPSGGLETRTGTRTQSAFTLSTLHTGAGAIAYRDGIISSVRGVSLKSFGGIIPFPSIGIQDDAYSDGIPRQVAIEKCLRYMRLDDADFEVDVSGEDSAWIIGAQLTLQDFLQRLRSIFVHYNITYTDKVRIIEPSNFSIDHNLSTRNLVRGSTRFSKGDPILVARRQNFSFIDVDRDNEPNVAIAQEDVYPQPSTSSVSEETIELPIVTSAAQATADNWVSFYEKMAAQNQMEGVGLTSLFGMEVGDGCRFQGDSAINSFMDKAVRAAETQHIYETWQVQFRGDEVLNCGAETSTGVEIEEDGYIRQAATAIADTDKMTWAGWVRLSDLSMFPLFFDMHLVGGFYGQANFLSVGGFNDNSVVVFLCDASGADQLYFESTADAFAEDAWVHVAFSADTSGGMGAKVKYLLVNGVDALDDAATEDDFGGFDIGVNGRDIYLPEFPTSRGGGEGDTPDIRYFDVQIWFGVAVDFSNPANIAKFIDGDGLPVDPAEAAAAFGDQTFLFSGDASEFVTNQGTGGAVTTSGSITDFAPGPP